MNELILKSLTILTVVFVSNQLTSCKKPTRAPIAHNGILNISKINLNSTAVKLNGEWKFTWNRLLVPSDFKKQSILKNEINIQVPGKWNDHTTNTENNPAFGYGTYRLEVILKDSGTPVTLLLADAPHTFKLFINGRHVASKGTVGTSEATSKPLRGNRITSITPQNNKLNIVIQTSNYHKPIGGLHSKIHLGTSASISKRLSNKTIVDGVLYGSIFIMAIYHFALFLTLRRRKSTLLFATYSSAILIRGLLGGEVGIMFVYFPEFPWELSWKLGYIGWFLAAASGIHYFQHLFQNEISPWAPRFIWSVFTLYTGFAIFGNVNFYESINAGYQVVLLLLCLYSIVGLSIAVYRQVRGSIIVLIGMLCVIIGATHEILRLNEIVSSGPEYLSVAVFCFIFFQSFIISMRFSDTFNIMEHAYTELSKVVYKNVIDKIHQGLNLEETMPTNRSDATLISFDIISSTTIKHPRVNIAIENTMAKCHNLLSKNYNSETLTANGYRIKESGDGLLCSVGYPFTLPKNTKNHQSEAIRFAEEFTRFFREEFSLLKYEEDLFCMVAVTSGSVEGYFPRSGIKQYDLRGRALALAKRYEEMKDVVLDKHGKQGSLLFIQKKVFDALDPKKQLEFNTWLTSEPNSAIRDDIDAKEAYFKFMPHPKAVI